MPFELVEANPKPSEKARHIMQSMFYAGGCMTITKAHKLMYYAQARHLVKNGRPLFPDAIVAWPHGPVVCSLWHQNWGVVPALTPEERQTIQETVAIYGQKRAFVLTRMTHIEAPWKDTRKGLPAHAKSSRIIPLEAIREFYSNNGFAVAR